MQEEAQADTGRIDGHETILEENATGIPEPPKATLKRRAQSYSDFHYAVKAVLDQDAANSKADGDSKLGERTIETEVDFLDWYNDLEAELLDSSYDDYTFVPLELFQ